MIYLGKSFSLPSSEETKTPSIFYDWLESCDDPDYFEKNYSTTLTIFFAHSDAFPDRIRKIVEQGHDHNYPKYTKKPSDTEAAKAAMRQITAYLKKKYLHEESHESRSIYLPYSIRDTHVHIMGKTGYGKSTLLHWLIYNDIKHGKSLCVIDPKGDLVTELLYWIPEKRIDDTLFLDIDDPIPLDFMSCSPGQEEDVVSDLKFILTKGVSTDHAPLMSSNLENIIYALLNANFNPQIAFKDRASFLDINDFLENRSRFEFLKSKLTDQRLTNFWDKFDKLNSTDKSRITSRMTPFIRSKTLAAIFGPPNEEPSNRLNIHEIVNGYPNKILLVKVPVRKRAASEYGALLVSKIQQAAFSRDNIKPEQRKPFYLHIDEFQNFRASEAFDKTLTMARGYKLCMTLANLRLDELDPLVKSALGIISTHIALQLYTEDTRFYRAAWDEHERLSRLPKYQAMYKIGDAPALFGPIPQPPDPPTQEQLEKAEYIKKRTLERYSCKPTPVADTEKHGKDDDIQPTAAPTHARKKKNA